VAFEQALVDGRNASAVLVTDRSDLAGLGDEEVKAAREAAGFPLMRASSV